MTYPIDAESTIQNDTELPQPGWLKALRYLVFALMLSSIFAMLAVGWAAYHLVTREPKSGLPENLTLPKGEVVSMTALANGESIVVYFDNGYVAIMLDKDGNEKQKVHFK